MVRLPGGSGASSLADDGPRPRPYGPQYQVGGTGFAGLSGPSVDVYVRPSDVVGSLAPGQFLRIVHVAWGMSPFEQAGASLPLVGLFKNAFLGDQCLGGKEDARFGHMAGTDILFARGDRMLAKFEDVPNTFQFACYLSLLFYVVD